MYWQKCVQPFCLNFIAANDTFKTRHSVTCNHYILSSSMPQSLLPSYVFLYASIYSNLFFYFADNSFVEEQISTGLECYQDDATCNKLVKQSICHPLGFCYCPDGTVLTQIINSTDIVTECRTGKSELSPPLIQIHCCLF